MAKTSSSCVKIWYRNNWGKFEQNNPFFFFQSIIVWIKNLYFFSLNLGNKFRCSSRNSCSNGDGGVASLTEREKGRIGVIKKNPKPIGSWISSQSLIKTKKCQKNLCINLVSPFPLALQTNLWVYPILPLHTCWKKSFFWIKLSKKTNAHLSVRSLKQYCLFIFWSIWFQLSPTHHFLFWRENDDMIWNRPGKQRRSSFHGVKNFLPESRFFSFFSGFFW